MLKVVGIEVESNEAKLREAITNQFNFADQDA